MALPKYKDIVDLMKKGATIEAQEQIMELREAAIQFQNENLQLKNKVKELGAALALKDILSWKPPYYINKHESDGKFCQRCYDADGKAIRLQQLEPGYWRCMQCENDYTDDSFETNSGDCQDDSGRNPITGY